MIFEIKGMTFSYWLILFSTSCVANLVGMNISSGLNSVITIYIVVPFLLIPQILLSGVLVKFDKLHKSISNYEYVPLIGDLMTSRWAFEALAVEQFKNNRYEKTYFLIDQEISNKKYYVTLLIPELEAKLNEALQYVHNESKQEQLHQNLTVLNNHMAGLFSMFPEIPSEAWNSLDIQTFDETMAADIHSYLKRLKEHLRQQMTDAALERTELEKQHIIQIGGIDAYTSLSNGYDNRKLADMLLNRRDNPPILEVDGQLIRKHEPVFMEPTSKVGRAHLYAPSKKIGGLIFDTLLFNVIFIWFTAVIFYITLYFDVLRIVISKFDNIKWRNRSRASGRH